LKDISTGPCHGSGDAVKGHWPLRTESSLQFLKRTSKPTQGPRQLKTDLRIADRLIEGQINEETAAAMWAYLGREHRRLTTV
jgi:hypothetical protein